MKWKWRLIWVTALVLLWLLCSGVAQAGPLAERLEQFPRWDHRPPLETSRGDLAYPEWFAGEWRVTTTLLDRVAPLAPDVLTPGFESNRQFLNRPIEFSVRFIEVEPSKLAFLMPLLNREPTEIVSDRAFNGLSLARAYLGDRAVQAVKVDPNNPNRQITLLRGDRQLVSTVTGRATEAPADDRFVTTEFFQQEFRGTSQIYFNEVENTTAYTRHPEAAADQPTITADQVTAIYLSPQDPDYFKSFPDGNLLADPRPVALYRYRMEFFPAIDPAPSLLPVKGLMGWSLGQ